MHFFLICAVFCSVASLTTRFKSRSVGDENSFQIKMSFNSGLVQCSSNSMEVGFVSIYCNQFRSIHFTSNWISSQIRFKADSIQNQLELKSASRPINFSSIHFKSIHCKSVVSSSNQFKFNCSEIQYQQDSTPTEI